MTAEERNELAAMQIRANQMTDESLESTRRMVALGYEAQEAGAETLVMLDAQGEQLDRIEEGMHQIDQDMKVAERNLSQMQKCCGLCSLPWNKSKDFEHSESYNKAWKKDKNGDIVKSQPTASGRHYNRDTAVPKGGYVERITNDAREDEMDGNLADVANIIGNLKSMAEGMGDEIDRQNVQIDRITDKGNSNIDRINEGNKQASKVLKQ